MKILITGSRGFVGQETKKLLEQEGHEVVDYDIMDGRDIRDLTLLRSRITNCARIDAILHLAAIARFADADRDPKLAFQTNVIGSANVAAVAREYKIPVVYSSTGSVYMPISETPEDGINEEMPARGNSVYGCTKYMGELYAKDHTPHIILRYAHLYGREKRSYGLIGGFLDRIQRGLAPTLYGGQQSNDFTYIKDVARANVLALTASWDKWNQVYNIGTGQELSAKDAGQMVCDAYGYTGEVEVKEGREVDAARFVYNTKKAESMLGFKAEYDFKSGLEDMFA